MIETIGTKVFGVSLQPKTLYDGFQNQHIENAENAGGKLECCYKSDTECRQCILL